MRSYLKEPHTGSIMIKIQSINDLDINYRRDFSNILKRLFHVSWTRINLNHFLNQFILGLDKIASQSEARPSQYLVKAKPGFFVCLAFGLLILWGFISH